LEGQKKGAFCDGYDRRAIRETRLRGLLRSVNNRVRREFPLAYIPLVQRPRAWFHFRDERSAIRGVNRSKSHHRSVVFFTAHKCVSVYISRILEALSEDAGMVHVDYESYFASTDVSRYDHSFDPRFQKGAFREQGYYYGAFRWFHLLHPLMASDLFRYSRDS
jgi:hypothetical protein